MEIYTMYEVGTEVQKDGKSYIIIGTVGINGYLIVEKDADPKELADVKFLQVVWVGNNEERKYSPEKIGKS